MTKDIPPDLGREGKDLWSKVQGEYVLDPAETTLLTQACRSVDELARLDKMLTEADLLVKGSMGQFVPNPLLAEIRGHRKVLESLLRSLALPTQGEYAGSTRSPQQAAAVTSRHRLEALRDSRDGSA